MVQGRTKDVAKGVTQKIKKNYFIKTMEFINLHIINLILNKHKLCINCTIMYWRMDSDKERGRRSEIP